MKKKVFIHVGPPKTGSSAIQAWLYKNSLAISKAGIQYPAHDISVNSISSGNRDSILFRENEHSNSWLVDELKVKKLLCQFEESHNHTLLLSSEFFFHKMEELATLIPNAIFIYYIRNPLELIESSYNQGVKRHRFVHKFNESDPFKSFNSNIGKLDLLISKFGNERFIIKSYDLAKKGENSGLIGDFSSIFSLSCNLENKPVNLSYCFEALEFKRLLNNFSLGTLNNKLDQLLQDYRHGTEKYSFIKPEKFSELKSHFSDEIAQFVDKYNFNQLKDVSEHYLNTQQRAFKNQTISLPDINNILCYLEKTDSEFYLELKERVSSQPYYKLDNDNLYKAFKVNQRTLPKVTHVNETLRASFSHLNMQNQLLTLRKLASYYVVNDAKNAKEYLELILLFDQNNKFAYNNLARLLVNNEDPLYTKEKNKPKLDSLKKVLNSFFKINVKY